jgi:flagellar hook-associated protein 3 FlgL
MKISTSFLFDRATSQMAEVQNRLAKTQAQAAEGKQVIAPSDAPEQAATIQRLKGMIARQDDYMGTLNIVSRRLQDEEAYLQSANDTLIRITELAMQAANDTYGPADREAISLEMISLRDHLMSVANAQDADGDYLFAGGRSMAAPYAIDDSGRVRYQGDQTRLQVLAGDTRRIQVNRAGSDIFVGALRQTPTGEQYKAEFFTVIDDLIGSVREGDHQLMNRGTSELTELLNGVSLAMGAVGADMSSVERQKDLVSGVKLRLQTTLSTFEDLDYAEAITQMNKEMLALEAAQSSFAKIAQLNLFNYIN